MTYGDLENLLVDLEGHGWFTNTICSLFQSPAEKVSMVCQKMTDGDLENLLVNLEVEEFLIDPRKKDKKAVSGEGMWLLIKLMHILI